MAEHTAPAAKPEEAAAQVPPDDERADGEVLCRRLGGEEAWRAGGLVHRHLPPGDLRDIWRTGPVPGEQLRLRIRQAHGGPVHLPLGGRAGLSLNISPMARLNLGIADTFDESQL